VPGHGNSPQSRASRSFISRRAARGLSQGAWGALSLSLSLSLAPTRSLTLSLSLSRSHSLPHSVSLPLSPSLCLVLSLSPSLCLAPRRLRRRTRAWRRWTCRGARRSRGRLARISWPPAAHSCQAWRTRPATLSCPFPSPPRCTSTHKLRPKPPFHNERVQAFGPSIYDRLYNTAHLD
jgi:hypothetical protein